MTEKFPFFAYDNRMDNYPPRLLLIIRRNKCWSKYYIAFDVNQNLSDTISVNTENIITLK